MNDGVFLRRATTAVGGIGLAVSSVPFMAVLVAERRNRSRRQSDYGGISASWLPRNSKPWCGGGKPIWLIRRTQAMLDTLPRMTDQLRDPLSEEDQQPPYAKNIYRAIKPEFFIAVGICTHLVVIPNYRRIRVVSHRIG